MVTQTVLIFSVLFGLALSAHSSPSGGMLIPDIVNRLWINSDINDDSHLSETEFFREFIDNFDHDGSRSVSENEFVHQWGHNYNEHRDVTLHVFQHFDLDGDNMLSQADLSRLFHHMDYNTDNQISKAEFTTLMAYIFGRLPYD
ncbi:uncharacterized protein LOC117333193 [Pecten maximus]|uniref:uncharacterized protein LOC117333193 n=1 Tax=Pecten maximus TaxID=6579 RepID=UPI0014590289|nr:uncharacterized protein LOC117333193 [Pecten maximus]XP_033748254.1 uncharacterized protein LOC117333193 [Pecten maximus]